MVSSTAERTVRNVSIIGASQLGALVLNFITMVVLASVLSPADFGVASIGIVFLALFVTIQDFGVLPAVVQRDHHVEDSISVGLTLRLMIAAMSFMFLVLAGPYISDFFGNDAIAPVLVVLGLNLFINSLAFQSLAMLTRTLRFREIAVATLGQYLVFAAVSISSALMGYSYWSIVHGSVAGALANAAVLMYHERTRLPPKMNLPLMKELMGFGSHLLVTGLMVFVVFNVDQLVIGRVLGMGILGVYAIAVRFGRTIGEQISAAVNKVLFPTMARMKDSMSALETGYVQSMRMISIVAVPICLGVSALSPLFVEVILGAQWAAAAVPLAILGVQGLLRALVSPAGNVLVSLGKPQYMSIQSTVQAVALCVAVYPVSQRWGVEGVCILTTALSLAVLVYFIAVFAKTFDSKVKNLLCPMAPSVIGGVVMYCCVTLVVELVSWNWITLAAAILIGIGTYAISLHTFSRGRDVREFLSFTARALRPINQKSSKQIKAW